MKEEKNSHSINAHWLLLLKCFKGTIYTNIFKNE